ncbi:molybdopterin cofactor-binding domain-containing protein [Novosphingobium sp.]|uniref:xanthine dehydrogenase family protein molybdopterin-binding subunit n=1 Tax=Novosphingobium sp. TaxID=1874826 RepID=UPI00333FFDE5
MTAPLPDDGSAAEALPTGAPVNVSRRRFLMASAGASAGAFVLGFGLPINAARADGTATAVVPGTRVPAFLEIRADNTVRLQCPFVEGGQGIFTAMAQLVGEELDADPATFVVENAPVGPDYKVMVNGRRGTGGSSSVRTSHLTMRRLGAIARAMLLTAGAQSMGVPVGELTTEPGHVVHARTSRRLAYGALAAQALDLPAPAPDSVTLKDKSRFRWIGKPLARVDVRAKSTGRAMYAIDAHVAGMLHAAIQHAPRLGLEPGTIRNADAIRAMHGVHSVHTLPGAVAVVAERFWHARRAVEAAQVDWIEPADKTAMRYMPADFSTEAHAKLLASASGPGEMAETAGDAATAFAGAASVITASYQSQFLNHAQLEPPSTLARFNPDGSLEVWAPNQSPDAFLADIAARAGVAPDRVTLHSTMLGGFFGRHFKYNTANPYPQAIALAKAVGRPVKVIWTREEEFLRDTLRPMALVQFRAGLDAAGMPVAIEAISACEGPGEGIANKRGEKLDASALEGVTGKQYAIPHRHIAQRYVKTPITLGYWRSVGHSMNDFFYECFLDEIAVKGGKDPYELRLHLLADNRRLTTLLRAVADLSGGWQPGPYTAPDGSRRARGIAMSSPFGSETAAIAEVSIDQGQVRVHTIWQAIDPGSIVNPAIVAAQVMSASALGLSQVLCEQAVYRDGMPIARNLDGYAILRPDAMAQVHTRIVESGEKMGGIGEPGLPAVPPAVANAIARLTGKPVRAMPLSSGKGLA